MFSCVRNPSPIYRSTMSLHRPRGGISLVLASFTVFQALSYSIVYAFIRIPCSQLVTERFDPYVICSWVDRSRAGFKRC